MLFLRSLARLFRVLIIETIPGFPAAPLNTLVANFPQIGKSVNVILNPAAIFSSAASQAGFGLRI